MDHLTLQEVVDRINANYPTRFDYTTQKEQPAAPTRIEDQSRHRPEFYIPRITRIFVSLLLGS